MAENSYVEEKLRLEWNLLTQLAVVALGLNFLFWYDHSRGVESFWGIFAKGLSGFLGGYLMMSLLDEVIVTRVLLKSTEEDMDDALKEFFRNYRDGTKSFLRKNWLMFGIAIMSMEGSVVFLGLTRSFFYFSLLGANLIYLGIIIWCNMKLIKRWV